MILPHLRLLCHSFFFFFFNDTATTEIYTLSLHDALPISGAATAGQQALEAGRSAASTATNAATGAASEARAWWDRNQAQPEAAQSPPSGAAPVQDDQGGPRRVMAVLGDAWTDSARRGQAVVALMDQGPYLVQRQAAHVAPAKSQWLALPRGDSTGVAIELPPDPDGPTYDP